jgi:hypothetical protein
MVKVESGALLSDFSTVWRGKSALHGLQGLWHRLFMQRVGFRISARRQDRILGFGGYDLVHDEGRTACADQCDDRGGGSGGEAEFYVPPPAACSPARGRNFCGGLTGVLLGIGATAAYLQPTPTETLATT